MIGTGRLIVPPLLAEFPLNVKSVTVGLLFSLNIPPPMFDKRAVVHHWVAVGSVVIVYVKCRLGRGWCGSQRDRDNDRQYASFRHDSPSDYAIS